jgi:[ribosomal protein S18]-alanine N-acetyltransferase
VSAVLLRRAAPADAAALVVLERAASLHPWNDAQIRAELAREAPDGVLVLQASDAPRGYCAYRVGAGELSVLNLAVDPGARRRGYGRALLAAALRAGARAGAARALLEVRASNAAALALYAHFGFERIGARRDYYLEPVEDALVLARALSAAAQRP